MAKRTMNIDLDGIDQLIGKLKRNATLDDVKDVVKLNTAEMQKSAQQYAPVDTGFLKRAISLNISDGGFTGVVVSASAYAPYQEYGTRFMYGTPHIGPAYHEQKLLFLTDMKRLMR